MIRAHGAGCSARATMARRGCRQTADNSSAAPSRSRSARATPTICFWGRRAACCAREMEGGTGLSSRPSVVLGSVFALAFAADGSRHCFDWPGDLSRRGREQLAGGLGSPRARRRREPLFAAAGRSRLYGRLDRSCFAAMIGVRLGRARPTASPRNPRQHCSWCKAHLRPFTRSSKAEFGRVSTAHEAGRAEVRGCPSPTSMRSP